MKRKTIKTANFKLKFQIPHKRYADYKLMFLESLPQIVYLKTI